MHKTLSPGEAVSNAIASAFTSFSIEHVADDAWFEELLKRLDLDGNRLPLDEAALALKGRPAELLGKYFTQVLPDVQSRQDFIEWYNRNAWAPGNAATAVSSRLRERPTVFISYSHRDSADVAELRSMLTSAGLTLVIDDTTLRFGDDIVQFIERRIRDTVCTIAVVSRNSLGSPWVIMEALEALMHEKAEGRKRFIPVYIDDGFLDNSLVDTIQQRIDDALRQLVDHTTQRTLKYVPTDELDFARRQLLTLRHNLSPVLLQLRRVAGADFSTPEKRAANVDRLIASVMALA